MVDVAGASTGRGRVLVTGAAGYIGSVLVRNLLAEGFFVRGFDTLAFGGESLVGVYSHPCFEFVRGDVRSAREVEAAVRGSDAVVHLAAIVGDPACATQPELATAVNWEASRSLFDLCRAPGTVKRFVFASTCSNYGKMAGDGFVNEESPLKPVSLYAELKVRFETYLLESEIREDLVPTALRFATAYGLSPRVRFDLTVNEFAREVALGRELEIFGEQFWRPYCHVDDLARACLLVLTGPAERVRRRVFGVGDTAENYQKAMLAEELSKIDASARFRFVSRAEDPRDYRVDFARIRNELGFRISRTVPQGLREVYGVVRDGLIGDPYSKTYKNT
jgi:nucleoside-diphosphate-sugar epimerase